MDILHQGFDGLDIAFAGALPKALQAKLEKAKENASVTMEDEYCELRGVDCWVKGTGRAVGYAYVLNTGPDGEVWAFKKNDDVMQWNVHVSVRALQLAVHGLEQVKARLFDTLRRWSCQITDESVSRVDYALDFVKADFQPDSKNIICHSHSSKRDHFDQEFFTDQFTRGNRVSTVTIGKMPGRQIQIYDKSREAKQTGKGHWFEIWGKDRETCPTVWRIEVRAGKKHLQNWNIRTLKDLREKIGTVFADDLERVRLIENPEAVNRGRDGILNPAWEIAREKIPDCLENCQNEAVYGRIVEGRREEVKEIYVSQVKGLMAGLSVTLGLTPKAAQEVLPAFTQEIIEHHVTEEERKFTSKVIKASKRLKFLEGRKDFHVKKSGDSEVSRMRQRGASAPQY